MKKNIVMIDENIKNELKNLGISIDGYDKVESLINNPENLSQIPVAGGVYVIITHDYSMPEFIIWQYGNYYKKTDRKTKIEKIKPLMYDLSDLDNSWISDTSILYLGKADNLNKRLGEYIRYYKKLLECQMDHNQFNQVPHRGGRSIWQIKGAENFIIAWMRTPNEIPADVESKLIDKFKEVHGGCRPFANKRD